MPIWPTHAWRATVTCAWSAQPRTCRGACRWALRLDTDPCVHRPCPNRHVREMSVARALQCSPNHWLSRGFCDRRGIWNQELHTGGISMLHKATPERLSLFSDSIFAVAFHATVLFRRDGSRACLAARVATTRCAYDSASSGRYAEHAG